MGKNTLSIDIEGGPINPQLPSKLTQSMLKWLEIVKHRTTFKL